ncbi:MAG: transposase [Microcystis sp. M_OC_Ca_00000000_S217Cul]|uniref:RNA-guided endonuclease InsQ/TnpB family protein n=1 Tax=Microcystis sp. M_OC_Ca_00000000_S217Cul TaxID=2486214 RepID=UPI001192F7A3|nr:transposase [Microcystis sp. M_OC_Ca_00000000_S217Cul]TRT73981.1 MAG: transposase [Microcystis sp. M_OC_Ca_00000000_S217Cul]
MLVAERHIIKKGHRFWAEIDNLSWQSKNLYNSANYLIRQNFIYGHGYLTYNQMASLMKKTEQYQALPAKVSQQVLRGLDRNWQSFFAAASEFKSHPDKFLGKPKIPGYKEPKKGRNLLVYTIQAISKVGLRQGLVKLSGTSIALPTRVAERIAEVRIVPKCDCYVIEVIYEKTEQFLAPNEKIAAIDLGIDNLMASLLKGNRQSSQRIRRLTRCRNQKVDDYLHQASRYLVNLLVEQEITTLVIGKNHGWKQEVNLGKVNNQKFVTIPHARLIEMISYKCQLEGISVILQEESYTSASNFLNDDPLPVYGKITEKPVFSGKRISRGLYRTDKGILVQSDVMGSYNILRKAFPNAFNRYGIERCVVHPRRINLSK